MSDVAARTILVPLDGTEEARAALPVARGLALAEGATLEILHVSAHRITPAEARARLGLDERAAPETVLVAVGQPSHAILAAARDRPSDALVLCTKTRRGGTHLLGRTAERVLLRAPCPVVLVRPAPVRATWSLRQALIPFDGATSTAVAMAAATELLGRSGTALLVLHVAEPGAAPSVEPGAMGGPRYVDQPQHEWGQWRAEVLERLSSLGHLSGDVPRRVFLAAGQPGEEIVRFAREHDVDLVVVAWHGRLGPLRAATARTLIRDTPCPLLTFRY